MSKKLLPKIKAIAPETAEVLETDARTLSIEISLCVIINGYVNFSNLDFKEYNNFFGTLKDIRSTLEDMYAFLNANLGTHYVVKNDTESNLKDLGYITPVPESD